MQQHLLADAQETREINLKTFINLENCTSQEQHLNNNVSKFQDFTSHIISLVLNTLQCFYITNNYLSYATISFNHNLMFLSSLCMFLFLVNFILKSGCVVLEGIITIKLNCKIIKAIYIPFTVSYS